MKVKNFNRRMVLLPALQWLTEGKTGFAEDLRDVKPPLVLPSYGWIWLVVFFVVLKVASVYCWNKTRRRRAAMIPKPGVVLAPWERAYQRLESLANGNLLRDGQWETYYLTLSDIIRRYFEERFEIRAPEMTSEEFLVSLRGFPQLSGAANNILKEFLDSCDMVKFARYLPQAAEAQKTTLLGRRLVDETKPNENVLNKDAHGV
ncbi:MAG: hypothetical protein HZA29_04615 [Candidatus Omnitrophica bacterium]|nr:hypothetical protein [Candidatus Omnitrophota bacterium]